ncbi:hypothetical protein MJO28_005975, partial [Puccinia striiformis f. sp. tritici]
LSEGTGVCFPNFCVFTLYPTCHPAAKHPVSKDRHEACVLHEDAKVISNILCLSQFLIDLSSAPASFPSHPQLAFLQQRRQGVHVWCAPRCFFGDLGPVKSEFLGLLLGPVGSSSTPITEDGSTNTKQSLIRIRAFVVTNLCESPQLRVCIFSPARDESNIMFAFRQAQVYLFHIWNYNLSIFFNIPQTGSENHCSTTGENQVFLRLFSETAEPILKTISTQL